MKTGEGMKKSGRLVILSISLLALCGLLPLVASAFHSNLGAIKLAKGLLKGTKSTLISDAPRYFQEAEIHFKRALSWFPNSSSASRSLGRIYGEEGDYPAAIKVLLRVVELRPRDTLERFVLGDMYAAMGEREKAIEEWRGVRNVDWYFVLQGRTNFEVRDFERALRGFELAAAIAPDSSEPYYQIGRTYQAQRMAEGAISALRTAIELDSAPSCVGRHCPADHYSRTKAHLALGETFLGQRRWSEAIGALEEAIQVDPRNDRAYIKLGWAVYRQTGDIGKAEALIRMAMALEPGNIWSYLQLSDIFLAEGDTERAAYWTNVASSVLPNDARVLLRQGQINYSKGNYQQAAGEFMEAINASSIKGWISAEGEAHYWLGWAYLQQGAYNSAIQQLEIAVQIDPRLHYYHAGLAEAYRIAQRVEDAIAEYQHALELCPDNATARRWLTVLQP